MTSLFAASIIVMQQQAPQPWWKDSQWLMLGATLAYTVVSLLMWSSIRAQNRSLQNTERAVLVPVWDNMVHINYGLFEADGPQAMHHTFNVNFRNCGKTPAFIRGVTAEMLLIPALESLPKKPKYGKLVHYAGDPVVPGATTDCIFSSPIKDTRTFEEIDAEIRSKKVILFVRGRVFYDDVFGRTHETRYGLRYRAAAEPRHDYDGFLVDGPKAYNRYI